MTTPARTRSVRPWMIWAIWALVFLVIAADVVRHPKAHNTTPTYRTAATLWWQGQDVYTYRPHDGFFYFPQAALIFTPFNVLPFYAGEIVWRVATFGLFAFALVRLRQVLLSGREFSPLKTLLVLSLLAIPSSFASLRNAQYDLPVAALVVLTAAEVGAGRWTAAAICLCLGVALKPLAMVPLLLFGALEWKLLPRLAIGLLIVVLLPFLHWSPAFVANEYARCIQTMLLASKGEEPRYSDLAALLSHAGYDAPDILKTAARLFFALVYLGLGALAVKRLPRVEAGWAIGALAADYLMLFNPRTETCSYVFLGPFLASLALLYGAQRDRRWLSYALGFAALGLACDAFPKIGAFSLHDLTDRWFKPLIALVFVPVLIQFILARRPRADSPAV